MIFKVERKKFADFVRLSAVTGLTAAKDKVTYFEKLYVNGAETEDGSMIRCAMLREELYCDIRCPVESLEESGQMVFDFLAMKSALAEMTSKFITISLNTDTIEVSDDDGWAHIPRLDSTDHANERAVTARKFQKLFDWDDEHYYYVNPTDGEKIVYDSWVHVDAAVLKSRLSRLNFLESVYYKLAMIDGKLGISVLAAEKGVRGKKHRTIPIVDYDGEFDVEYKEGIQPVISTIGTGIVMLYYLDMPQIPTIVHHETQSGVQAMYTIPRKTTIRR